MSDEIKKTTEAAAESDSKNLDNKDLDIVAGGDNEESPNPNKINLDSPKSSDWIKKKTKIW